MTAVQAMQTNGVLACTYHACGSVPGMFVCCCIQGSNTVTDETAQQIHVLLRQGFPCDASINMVTSMQGKTMIKQCYQATPPASSIYEVQTVLAWLASYSTERLLRHWYQKLDNSTTLMSLCLKDAQTKERQTNKQPKPQEIKKAEQKQQGQQCAQQPNAGDFRKYPKI